MLHCDWLVQTERRLLQIGDGPGAILLEPLILIPYYHLLFMGDEYLNVDFVNARKVSFSFRKWFNSAAVTLKLNSASLSVENSSE